MSKTCFPMRTIGLFLSMIAMAVVSAECAEYQPDKVATEAVVTIDDLVVDDEPRSRKIPIRVYRTSPPRTGSPVILFSHGLGGSKNNNPYLGNHWAKRGYVAIFLQHQGSDEAVWKETPLRERAQAMQKAASAQNLVLRCGDVRATIDRLEEWNQQTDHLLYQCLDLDHLGMTGHSFGAHTTQAVAGQSFPLVGTKFLDPRIDAALAMSPSSPALGSKNSAFAKVQVPWMLMTGTMDASPIGNQTIASRFEVFPNLPQTIDRFELVLHEAEHSAFGERPLPGDSKGRNPNHHRAILALSTAFWDAYLKEDKNALAWLTGRPAKSVLEAQDRWQYLPAVSIKAGGDARAASSQEKETIPASGSR